MSMERSPLVSVIVPVYNAAGLLETTLKDIAAQTYTHLEIVLIDDGSTDLSPEICDRFAEGDDRVKVVHQKNAGLPAARKRGLEESTGPFVMYMDNDDRIHRECVEIMVDDVLETESDIAIVKAEPFLEDTVVDARQKERIARGAIARHNMSRTEICEALLDMAWNGVAVVMTKLYKRELFQSVTFPIGRTIGEDDSIVYRLYWQANQVVLCDTALCYYRSKRPGSMTHSGYRMDFLSSADAFRERMTFFKDRQEPLLYAKAKRTFCRNLADHYVNMKQFFPEEKDIIRTLKSECNRETRELLFLKGNSAGQKISALLYALFPVAYHRFRKEHLKK